MRQNSFLLFLIFLTACSTQVSKEKSYNYPTVNPYPELFTTFNYSEGKLLTAKLDPSTVKVNCSKRNDQQPYYWCEITGEFFEPVKQLPKKLEGHFHVQLPKMAVINIKSLIRKESDSKNHLTLILHRDPQINKEGNFFWNKLFGFYNSNFCVAFLGLEKEICPKSVPTINIYQSIM